MASIEDVANKAGVSVSTVSFVLNGRAEEMRISEKTINKVFAASQELGYIPNLAAKKLSSRGGSSLPEVALFWTPVQNSTFLTVFISEAQALFDEGGAREMRFVVEPFRTGKLCQLEDVLTGGQYNGVIVPPVSLEDIEYMNSLDLHIPVVMLHGGTDKYSMLSLDNYEAGHKAAEIFAARGFKKVAVVNHKCSSEDYNVMNRSRGFLDACDEYGLTAEIIDAEMKQIPGMAFFNKNAGLGSIAAENLLRRGSLPEAVFIQNDSLAARFMNTMTDAGVKVPGDLEIITFGNEFLSETCRPSMTAIQFPTAELTREAIMLMSDLLVNPLAPLRRKTLIPKVIFRQSCPKPPGF